MFEAVAEASAELSSARALRIWRRWAPREQGVPRFPALPGLGRPLSSRPSGSLAVGSVLKKG